MDLSNLDAPVFVIGSPRSGTSLLRLMLTSHSGMLMPPECGFIIWLREKYGDWQAPDNENLSRLTSFIDDLFVSKKFETWLLEKGEVQSLIAARQPDNYAELCAIVYLSYGASIGKRPLLWGDKNNFHVDHLYELLDLYSKARFLHIVRDGRDVACSYREVMAGKSSSPYAPRLVTDISAIASEWSNNVLKVDSFMSSRPYESKMTIRYEDLVINPYDNIKVICEWLGLIPEPDMLEFYKHNKRQQLEPTKTMDWKKRTMQPINSGTVGRYRGVLSESEQSSFKLIAQNALHRFSYL